MTYFQLNDVLLLGASKYSKYRLMATLSLEGMQVGVFTLVKKLIKYYLFLWYLATQLNVTDPRSFYGR